MTRTPASQVTQTWSTYCDAYRDRYGIEPVRNAKVNSQLKQFAQRVPAEDWAATIQHYLRSRNARYVAAGHSVGALLADAEKLRTEALTGKNGTAAGARRDDALADKGNQLEELLEWNRAREAARAEGRLGDGE